MIVLNLSSHELSEQDEKRLSELIADGKPIPQECIHNLFIDFEDEKPFVEQFEKLLDELPISRQALQSADRLFLNPPGQAHITVLVVSYLHGLRGSFPSLIRVGPVSDGTATRYEIIEVIDLQASVRRLGRRARNVSPPDG